MNNGYILVGLPAVYGGMQYAGMDTEPFPLAIERWPSSLSREERALWEDRLLFSEDDVSLMDVDMARTYFHACLQHRLSVRLLYADIQSQATFATGLPRNQEKFARFLGYDVGECAYDFSSAIVTDILLRPALLPHDFRTNLNEHGLFRTAEDAYAFLHMRTNIKQQAEPMTLEAGTCHVVALYELPAEALDNPHLDGE